MVCRLNRVFCVFDGSSHHDIVGTVKKCLPDINGALLIVGVLHRADTGRDHQKMIPE